MPVPVLVPTPELCSCPCPCPCSCARAHARARGLLWSTQSSQETDTPARSGTFYLHWSTALVEGALARFVTAEPIPPHVFTTNYGISEICRGAAPGSGAFFKGWTSFVRTAHRRSASLTLMGQVAMQPVAVYVNDAQLRVTPMVVRGSVPLRGLRAVAVTAQKAVGFDKVHTMETRMFQQVASRVGGSSVAFDGGGDGVADATLLSPSTGAPSSLLKSPRRVSRMGARFTPGAAVRACAMQSQSRFKPEMRLDAKPPADVVHSDCHVVLSDACDHGARGAPAEDGGDAHGGEAAEPNRAHSTGGARPARLSARST
eukprot:5126987-Prymnesium_polylepis.1